MGFIRQSFGRISIESRRGSFYIHPDYGYRPLHVQRCTLMPSDYFKYNETTGPYRVKSIDENYIYTGTFKAGRDGEWVIPCDADGTPLDTEDDPDSGNFGEHWRVRPHPEFLNEDIPDLIAALEELRGNPR